MRRSALPRALALASCAVGLAGCTLGLGASLVAPSVGGRYAFAGAQQTVSREGGGSTTYTVPASAGLHGPRSVEGLMTLGFDLPWVVGTAGVGLAGDESLQYRDVSILYRHPLPAAESGRWNVLGGLQWAWIDAHLAGEPSEELTTDAGESLAPRYELTRSASGAYLTAGAEYEFNDWLRLQARIAARFSHDEETRESLTVRLEENGRTETVAPADDPRFEVAVQRAGTLDTSLEAPILLAQAMLTVTWPTFASQRRQRPAPEPEPPVVTPTPDENYPPPYPAPHPAPAQPGAPPQLAVAH